MKLVSLFSGSGGLDLGFIKNGFEVIWANDFEEETCHTYKENIGDHIVCGDITKISVDDIPDCDGIIGGSPCQGFSNANRQTNFLDNPKNFLVKEFIRVVKGKKPKFFVLENVPKLITAGKGRFIQEIKNELKDYKIEIKIMNAVDYGSSQKRKRAILIGCLNGTIEHPKPTHNIYRTVEQCFEGLHDEIPNQLDITNSGDNVKKRMSFVGQGGNWSDVPKELWANSWKVESTHSSIHRRLKLSEPSITITNFRKSLITHPTLDRIISIREAARIQGYPDDFIFYGGLSKKSQMVANSVPVDLSSAIAKHIKEHYVVAVENKIELLPEYIVSKDTYKTIEKEGVC